MAKDGQPAAPGVDRPVFVVGPPRSGTTMLRHALNRHPDLAIAPETHLLDVWLPRFPGLEHGEQFDAFWQAYAASEDFSRSGLDHHQVRAEAASHGQPTTRAIFVAILSGWARQQDACRMGEKTPAHALHLDTLFQWFEQARVIWLTRDPRDAVASQLVFEQEWTADDPVAAARHYSRIGAAHRRWSDDPRVLTISYEALVTAPTATLARVLEHAGLPVDESQLVGPAPRDGTWHGGQDPVARPTTDSIGRWAGRLSALQAGIVDVLTVRARRSAGYRSVARDFAGIDRCSYHLGRAQGLATTTMIQARRFRPRGRTSYQSHRPGT